MSWSGQTRENLSPPRRCARVGCSNRFFATGRRSHQRYCSHACANSGWLFETGRMKKLPRGPQRKLESLRCLNGHDREHSWRNSKGVLICRECAKAHSRAWRARQKEAA